MHNPVQYIIYHMYKKIVTERWSFSVSIQWLSLPCLFQQREKNQELNRRQTGQDIARFRREQEARRNQDWIKERQKQKEEERRWERQLSLLTDFAQGLWFQGGGCLGGDHVLHFHRARQEIREKLEQDRRERMSRSLQSSSASVSSSTSTESGRSKEKATQTRDGVAMMLWWERGHASHLSILQTYVRGQMEATLLLDPIQGEWLGVVSDVACLLTICSPISAGALQAVSRAGQTSRRREHHLLAYCYGHCGYSPKDDCRGESHFLVVVLLCAGHHPVHPPLLFS